MNDIQECLMDMISDIKTVFEENEIPFYIVGGGAIGVLRHKGFIPWDDDLDVAVLYDYREKVDYVLRNKMDTSKYYLDFPGEGDYPKEFYRISRKGTTYIMDPYQARHQAICIEVFIMENVPDGILARPLYDLSVASLVGLISINDSWLPHYIKMIALKMKILPRTCADMLKAKKGTNVGMWNTFYFKEMIPKAWFGKPTMREFEGMMLPFPEKIHEYLTKGYGDYMTPPPVEMRVKRFIRMIDLERDYSERIEEAKMLYDKGELPELDLTYREPLECEK